ncbi:hypothetical protein CPB85DRAFT_226249 [Mucidula mucida]|nr:hypothetical protein CPB85DRAFT_226249 [Mucidula mucida]
MFIAVCASPALTVKSGTRVPSSARGGGCITRIPPEILSEIFQMCCDLEHEHAVNVGPKSRCLEHEAPRLSFLSKTVPQMYKLRHVCRFWRDTIDGTSAFWRRIRIVLGETVTADNEAHLNFLFDRSGNGTMLHLDGVFHESGTYPAVRWSQIRRLRVTSVKLSANFWMRVGNIDHIDFIDQFFTRQTGPAVVALRSVKRVTLTKSVLPEGLHLPSLVELDVDRFSMEHHCDHTQPISFILGSALAKFQCRLTTLRIHQDRFPLHISDTHLTRELRYLRCLVVEFHSAESHIYGVGHEEYNEAISKFADILRVTSETRVLPSLEDARLTVTCVAHANLRIRTISAVLVMLRSRASCGMKVFGIHAYSGDSSTGPRREVSIAKLSEAFPPVTAVNDLLKFRDIDIKMTSNGGNIFG